MSESVTRHYVLQLDGKEYIVEAWNKVSAVNYLAKRVITSRLATHLDMLKAGREGAEILRAVGPAKMDLVDESADG